MKNLSKVVLLALIIAFSVEACTKSNNSTITPKAATVNKAGSTNTLFKRDTITPLFKRDTITPKLILLKHDTITPKAAVRDTITPKS